LVWLVERGGGYKMSNKTVYATVNGKRLGAMFHKDKAQVLVWVVNGGTLSLYNIDRFDNSVLTAGSLTKLFGGNK
jgi:hypothetical protein